MPGAKAAAYLAYARLEQQGRTKDKKNERGISSAGRAPALQAGGRRFDPVILHHHLTFNTKAALQKAALLLIWHCPDHSAVL